jgi:hypothetical protein
VTLKSASCRKKFRFKEEKRIKVKLKTKKTEVRRGRSRFMPSHLWWFFTFRGFVKHWNL